MKLKYLLIAVLAGAALVGCNRTDDLEVANDGVSRYVAFELVTPTATKGSEPGTTPADNYAALLSESDIKNIKFIFYRNGAYLTTGKTTVVPTDFNFDADVTNGASVERRSNKLVVVLESTGAYPTHVLCLANFSAADFALIDKKNLSGALETVNAFGAGSVAHRHFVYEEGGKQYFMMTNSAHIDASNKVVDAYPVMEEYIFPTEADAIKEGNDKVIRLYLDRISSKVDVINTKTSETLNIYGETPISIELKSWGLNEVNRKSYFVKNIDAWNKTDYPWMHIGRTGDEFYRISWAKDPNYTPSQVPLASYPNDAEHYEKNTDGAEMFYYSLNGVLENDYKKLETDGSIVADGTFKEYEPARDLEKRFCFENTFDDNFSPNYRRVGTHVLVIAQAKFGDTVKDFYKYNGVCYDLAGYKAMALGINGFQQEFKFYTKVAADTYEQIKPEDLEIHKAVVKEKTATQPAKIVKPVDKGYSGYEHSDGFVSLFLTDTAEGKTWYYADASKTTVKDTDVTVDTGAAKLKEALATKLIERADAFTNGMMYYCVPLEHYNTLDLDALDMGMYGMVRNHFYQVVTGEIKTLGKGIYDPGEIIVPGDKVEMWYLAAKININAWHIVKQVTDLAE